MLPTKSFVKTLLLLGLLSLITKATEVSSKIHEINSQDDLFLLKATKRVLGIVFYQPSTANFSIQELKKILVNVRNKGQNVNQEVDLAFVDLQRFPFFISHFDLEEINGSSFLLFVKGNPIQFFDFPEISIKENADFIESKLVNFLHKSVAKIIRPVKDIESIAQLSKDHNIGLFYAKDEKSFEMFWKLALIYPEDNFFRIEKTDDVWATSIIFDFQKALNSTDDFLVFIRAESQVNQLDPKSIIYQRPTFSKAGLKNFYEFASLPKIRSPTLAHTTSMKLFHRGQPGILLCLKGENQEKMRSEFEDAIKHLPRNIVYSIVELDNENSSPLQQLAFHAGVHLKPFSMYFVYTEEGQVRFLPATNWRRLKSSEINQSINAIFRKNKKSFPLFEDDVQTLKFNNA